MIQKIYIERFGGLREKEIEFSDGLNIVYGENEAGKSTIQAFILAMLYGIDASRKSDIRSVLRKRYMPKDADYMAGSLETDTYIIMRKFGKSIKSDVCEVIDKHTGVKLSDYEIGTTILGVNQTVFCSTLFIEQFDAHIKSNHDVISRLDNLEQTGDESVSYNKTMQILKEQKKQISKSKHAIIPELEAKIAVAQSELEQQKRLKQQMSESTKEYHMLKVRLGELLQKQAVLSKKRRQLHQYEQYIQKLSIEKEYDVLIEEQRKIEYQIGELNKIIKISKEQYQKAQTLYAELNSIREYPCGIQKSYMKFMAAVFGMVGFLFLLAFVNPLFLVFLISFIPMAMCIKNAAEHDRQKKLYVQQQHAAKKIEQQLQDLFTATYTETIDELSQKYVSQSTKQAERSSLQSQLSVLSAMIQNKQTQLMLYSDITAVHPPDMDAEKINIAYNSINTQIIQENKELVRLEYELKEYDEGKPDELQNTISEYTEKLNQAKKELLCIHTAEKVITDVYEELKSDFTPKLNERISEIFSYITNGKYQQVAMSAEFDVNVIERSTAIEASYLSNGTLDAVYFSIRLGIIDMIFKNNTAFMVMDDVFLQYDDNRAQNAAAMLRRIADTHQIIYFTCQSRLKPFGHHLIVI